MNHPPWIPERIVDPGLALELIEAQFPQLRGATIAPFGEGFDNTAYRVASEWVFRFPRRNVAVPLLLTEGRVMPELSQHLPLPVPNPVFLGQPTDAFDWPFLGYRLLEGTPSELLRLSNSKRAAMASTFGTFLGALHRFNPDRATAMGVERDRIGKLDVPLRQRKTREMVELLKPANLLSPGLEKRLLARVDGTAPLGDFQPVVVHGDLYARHFLCGEGALKGVIDWGDLALGHPAIDLGGVLGFLPPAAWSAFAESYGPIDAHAWELARFRALTHQITVAAYAKERNDPDLLDESLGALERASAEGVWSPS